MVELRSGRLARAGKRLEEILVPVQAYDLVDAVAQAQLAGAWTRVICREPVQRGPNDPGPVGHLASRVRAA